MLCVKHPSELAREEQHRVARGEPLLGLRGEAGDVVDAELGGLVDAPHFEQEIVFTADASGAPRVVTRIGHDSAGKFLAAMTKPAPSVGKVGAGVPSSVAKVIDKALSQMMRR